MARLIYFPQTDERPTPPPPLNIDEDSDGWWAGAQRCFVAVPIASAIAGIALMLAIDPAKAEMTSDPAHVDSRAEKPRPWPGGIIPYDISNLTGEQQATVKEAMR